MKLFHSSPDITGPINLGNPAELTVIDLAHRIVRLANSKSPIVHMLAAVDDPKQRRPDIGRAAAQLGWRPNIDIDNGLLATIDHFDQVLRHAAANN
jgi:UDP-glucuronate decarboxylase